MSLQVNMSLVSRIASRNSPSNQTAQNWTDEKSLIPYKFICCRFLMKFLGCEIPYISILYGKKIYL